MSTANEKTMFAAEPGHKGSGPSGASIQGRLSSVERGSNSFILAHEFAHALIANFELPVLDKEESAADSIATAVLRQVSEGAVYAADAASFWADFSDRREPPAVSDYADAHRSTFSVPSTSSAGSQTRAGARTKK